jgi:hypothetical protein
LGKAGFDVLRRGFVRRARACRHRRRVTSLQAADNAEVMGELQFRHVAGTPSHAGAPLKPVGTSLLANTEYQAMMMSTDPTSSRTSHAPTVIRGAHRISERHTTCRSEPARDSGMSGNDDVEHIDAIGSRLAPTLVRVGLIDPCAQMWLLPFVGI